MKGKKHHRWQSLNPMMMALGKICQSVNVVYFHLSKEGEGLLTESK